jgi:hypothetical protein
MVSRPRDVTRSFGEMDESMVTSSWFRARCLHCALIALAIQGMTPDPDDMTSGSISKILQSIVGDGVLSKTEKLPASKDATDDEKPDEVCTPASTSARPTACERVDRPIPSRRPERASKSRSSLTHSITLRCSTKARQLLAFLCRFTC